MNLKNWKEFKVNGVEVTYHLNTKDHHCEIWLGSLFEMNDLSHYRSPDMRFTKAKGACALEFLERLKDHKA